MEKRLLHAREKVGEALRFSRERVQGVREPLTVESVEEFMGLVAKHKSSVVELFPTYRKEGFYYSRDKRKGEYVGGINEPTWVTEFRHTGYTFFTQWKARTLSNRRVDFNLEHETIDRYGRNGYTSRMSQEDIEKAKEKWFRETVSMAERQHQQFPHVQFMIQGYDGLQEYSYYMGEEST